MLTQCSYWTTDAQCRLSSTYILVTCGIPVCTTLYIVLCSENERVQKCEHHATTLDPLIVTNLFRFSVTFQFQALFIINTRESA